MNVRLLLVVHGTGPSTADSFISNNIKQFTLLITLANQSAYLADVVVIVMTSPSCNAYMGRQVPRRDEEFHQIHVVLKYIFDVNDVTEMTLTFRCPPWT